MEASAKDVYHLYSGGKDSSLAAWILRRMGYRVVTVTITFGILENWRYARKAAAALGFEHTVLRLKREIAERAVGMIIEDGHPNRAIQFVHKKALESVASLEGVSRISDGTRRDDRVPLLSLPEVRSLEDRFKVAYIRPLLGLGYKTINELTGELFLVKKGESEKFDKADYEAELRELLRIRGLDPLEFFPKGHIQSRVVGWRECGEGGKP